MANTKKTKIDFDHLDFIKDKTKQKRVKAKYDKVKSLIRSDIATPMIDDTGSVEIVADTPRRVANGRPSAEIHNPDLEAALDDIITLAGVR